MTRSMQAVPKADAPRIPMPAVDPALNLTPSTWKVLTDSIFPAAKTAEGILLAVHYCAARNLDVIKRPVHVVPMWSKALGQEIETVWPGIAEVQTTAARTGQWAGIDPPRFGPVIERTFSGKVKRNGAWQDLDYAVSFPEWCEVTVYRLVGGQRCPFTEPVFWLEAYARQGGAYSELPTEMWVKRPRGQLMKCAKAASLRAAFPEEASYTAEEMEGKVIEADTSIPVAASLDATGTVPAKADTAPSGVAEAASDAAPSKASETPTDSEPRAEPITLDPSLQARIDKVVARAAEKSAWKQAEQYLRARCKGAELKQALEALDQAQQTAEQRLAA
ncbi:recombinase RecT [Thiorhodovibrio frisius]|uniref:RecT family n=1 Tax=Thiorhodovibrio frisius TaxID=631362 RepID=H8YVI7_9GAMM|nr:recombinase RecT [Thiorhodovibrio frisius]EIC23927.1 RecT family [Thiorhodovibrio frisius]WPL23179.1 phage recombination protein Bet [Thiorhodovibrio frisius]